MQTIKTIKEQTSENKHYMEFIELNFLNRNAMKNYLKNRHEISKCKYDCVAYLFELCYDLMLSSSSNASQNPGFEKFIGINAKYASLV